MSSNTVKPLDLDRKTVAVANFLNENNKWIIIMVGSKAEKTPQDVKEHNDVVIQMFGPDSVSENIVTHEEAQILHRQLGKFLYEDDFQKKNRRDDDDDKK